MARPKKQTTVATPKPVRKTVAKSEPVKTANKFTVKKNSELSQFMKSYISNTINPTGYSYDSAKTTQSRSDWTRSVASSDSELLSNLPAIRARSRDMYNNHPLARSVIDIFNSYIIGTGIKPKPSLDPERLNISQEDANNLEKQQLRYWQEWIEECDLTGQLHFNDIQRLVYQTKNIDGESFAVIRRIDDDSKVSSINIELIDADRLKQPYGLKTVINDKKNGSYSQYGIEYNIDGMPIKYWFQKEYGLSLSLGNFVDIDATANNRKQIIHYFEKQRVHQSRGVPLLSPVLTTLFDQTSLLEAERIASRLEAMITLSLTTSNPEGTLSAIAEEMEDGEFEMSWEPGSVNLLPPGMKPELIEPKRPNANFPAFMKLLSQMVSGGVGLPYELVSSDYSNSKYSSIKAALNASKKLFEIQQSHFINCFLKPIYILVMEDGYLRGQWGNDIAPKVFNALKREWTKSEWITPMIEFIDPLKDITAIEKSLAIGLTNYADVSNGDFEMIQRRLADEIQLRTELGLTSFPMQTPEEKVEFPSDIEDRE